MSAQPIPQKMSEEEYLSFERASEFKHECVNIEVTLAFSEVYKKVSFPKED